MTDIHLAIRALAILNMSKNMLATKEAGKALANALTSNPVLKELDVSGNAAYPDGSYWGGADGPGFAQEFAIGVKNNGALETIIFGDKQAVTMPTDMAEADLSGKQLGASGAIIVATFLPKCQ